MTLSANGIRRNGQGKKKMSIKNLLASLFGGTEMGHCLFNSPIPHDSSQKSEPMFALAESF
jgi:hypothetical protein